MSEFRIETTEGEYARTPGNQDKAESPKSAEAAKRHIESRYGHTREYIKGFAGRVTNGKGEIR